MQHNEPVSILRFFTHHFDAVKDLYDYQIANQSIPHHVFLDVIDRHKSDVGQRFFDYKILRLSGEEYVFRKEFFDLLQYLYQTFRPVLPETIDKYNQVFGDLFRQIIQGLSLDRDILEARIMEIMSQAGECISHVERNTFRLLTESRELKANAEKMDYRSKLQKATFWIDYYIVPLNRILDVNNPSSVAFTLSEISEFANRYRLNFADEGIRRQFEKLYVFLMEVHNNLIKHSRTLTNELLPLIERIRTESAILSGWIHFLKNPFRMETPTMIKEQTYQVYASDMYYQTKEFFEQFETSDEMIIEDDEQDVEKWIYHKNMYRDKLLSQLPIENFFEWAATEINAEFGITQTDKLFTLAGLLFEENLQIEFTGKTSTIETSQASYTVPNVKIESYGISQ
ncbi:MAG: hypothetical protein IAE67_05515 [Candidatus Competibacteraceae bacterium]|nr:hypothetical protein [Candidatus Competibacteraceae bacterium]